MHKQKPRLSDFKQRKARIPYYCIDDYTVIIQKFLIALDTPVSLGVWLRYKHGEHRQLAELEINPLNYNRVDQFRDDFHAVSLLKKAKFLKTGLDLRQSALNNFAEGEKQCDDTNRRMSNLMLAAAKTPHLVSLLNAMTRKIALWLDSSLNDPFQGYCIDEHLNSCAWGPGVTQLLKGDDTSASRKFYEERSITSNARRVYLTILRQAYPLWESLWQQLVIVDTNVVITVPKNAKTDRTIAVEPGLNIWLQLGLGKMIRRRIQRQGYDLNSTTFNESMAKLGSVTNDITTVDFSMASDTVSRKLVELLMPKAWFFALDSCRSPGYKLDGAIHTYEKFSAMGCGFTWELESLIFLSAAVSCCEVLGISTENVGVFGDDVTLPSQAYPLYCELSSFLGFTVNRSKSYTNTYYRESCGSYYFKGTSCKPFFFKEEFHHVQGLYNVANSIRSLAHNRCDFSGCDLRFLDCWQYVVGRVPRNFRYLIPVSSGDRGIHSNFDEASVCLISQITVDRRQWCGVLHYVYGSSAQRKVNCSLGHLNAQLHRLCDSPTRSYYKLLLDQKSGAPVKLESSSAENQVSLRGKMKLPRRIRVFTSHAQWQNLGPWI